MSSTHPHCPMCGGSWHVQNARCGSDYHWEKATEFAVWLRWQVFWNAMGDAVLFAEMTLDACEHCGALPNEQDNYWADGAALGEFHENHCPHCGAYHALPRNATMCIIMDEEDDIDY